MPDDTAVRHSLTCQVHPQGALCVYKYVVVCTRYRGQWMLSRHKARDTWETQGGHIEKGETPAQAAARELYEESGVRDAKLYAVCDYHGVDAKGESNGMVFLADVKTLGALPQSEMKEARLFDALPERLTYPLTTPVLVREAAKVAEKMGI